MTTLNEGAVSAALKSVQDPELGKSLADLRMIDQIRIAGGNSVNVKIDLPTHAYPRRERLADAIRQAIQTQLPDAKTVDVEFQIKTS